MNAKHAQLVANPNATTRTVSRRVPRGRTVLMEAGLSGDSEAILLLLAAGALIDAQDEGGITALMCAAREDRIEAMEALILAGAARDLTDRWGRTAEDLASEKAKPILTALREDALLKQAMGVSDMTQKKERTV